MPLERTEKGTVRSTSQQDIGNFIEFEGETYYVVVNKEQLINILKLMDEYRNNIVLLGDKEIYVNNLVVTHIKDMSSLFYGLSSFNFPINNWDTSNVFNMSNMFSSATSFNQNINNWDTSNVFDMSFMFDGAYNFNFDNAKWYVPFNLIEEYVNNKNIDGIKEILDKEGMNLFRKFVSYHDSLLHYAAFKGYNELINLLLDRGFFINYRYRNNKNEFSNSVLYDALDSLHFDTIKLLLENGADPDLTNSITKKTPLFKLITMTDYDLYRIIREQNLSIDSKQLKIKFIKLLLDYNPDINIKTKDGTDALKESATIDKDIFKLLLDNTLFPELNDINEPILHGLISSDDSINNIDVVQLVIEKGADVNLLSSSGETPLLLSCVNGNIEYVKLLLENGADPNFVFTDSGLNNTVLFYAFRNNKQEIIEELLKAGADLHRINIDNISPIDKIVDFSLDNCISRNQQLIKKVFSYLKPINFDFTKYTNSNIEDRSDIFKNLYQNISTFIIKKPIISPDITTEEPITINSNIIDDTLYYDTDLSICDISNNLQEFKKMQTITKQAINSYIGYNDFLSHKCGPLFYPLNVKFDDYPQERGFDTGPTKQIMNYLSRLLNYIINYRNDELIIKKPKWVIDQLEKDFYKVLTSYIVMDVNYRISKFDINMPFHLFIKPLVYCLENNINTPSLNLVLQQFKEFVGFTDDKLYKEDSSPIYDVSGNIELYYNKICLYLLDDMFEGGNQYSYLSQDMARDYLLDPENDFLTGKIDSYKLPEGFMDYDAFNRLLIPDAPLDQLIFYLFFYLKSQSSITSELFLSKIKYYYANEERTHGYLFDYMKKLINDYTNIEDEELKNSILEQYPTKQKFLEKLLLSWTASNNINDDTVIKMFIDYQPQIQFTTCHNTLVYPIARGEPQEITYEEFVNVIISAISGTSNFGLRGGKRRKTRRNKKTRRNINVIKHKKTKRNKKQTKKINSKTKKIRKYKKNNKKTRRTKH